jgi:hypothetical protein
MTFVATLIYSFSIEDYGDDDVCCGYYRYKKMSRRFVMDGIADATQYVAVAATGITYWVDLLLCQRRRQRSFSELTTNLITDKLQTVLTLIYQDDTRLSSAKAYSTSRWQT